MTISNIVIRITKEETDIAYTCDQGPKERHTHTHTDTQYRRCVCIYAYEKQGEREKQRITKKFWLLSCFLWSQQIEAGLWEYNNS